MIAEFRKANGVDLHNDKMALQRLKDEPPRRRRSSCRACRRRTLNLPYVTVGAGGPMHLDMRLSRAKLEQMIAPLVERSMEPVRKALADAKKTAKDIDEVVLVGGSTRIPLVQETVKKFFGQGAAQGRQPRRGRGHRRRRAGGRARGRRQGHRSSRRHAAVARRRDAGRRHDVDDPAQHDHPDAEARRSSRPRPTTSPASRSTFFRASVRMRSTTARSASSTSRASCPRRGAYRRSR